MVNSHSHKNDCSSSSESFTSNSNNCTDKKYKKKKDQTSKKEISKDQPTKKEHNKYSEDKINNLLVKMNKCVKIVKKSDNNLDKINKKIKELKNECVNYMTIVDRLRKEKHLMINGSDSYGVFYSNCPQTIEPNNKIIFEKKSHILNLGYDDCDHSIKIKRSGMYIINLTCQFEQSGQIAIFINDNPDLISLTASNNPQNFITIHQIVNLNKGDHLSIRNYLSPYPLTTLMPSAGIIPESKNICLNIWKIAPEPEKCALPPKQNKDAWCYFSSNDSSSESSDYSTDCDIFDDVKHIN